MEDKWICRECGCDEHNEEYAKCCHNCGTPLLENYCSNPHCDLNSYDSDDDRTPLPPDYCYCDTCGSETEYFIKGYTCPKRYKKA